MRPPVLIALILCPILAACFAVEKFGGAAVYDHQSGYRDGGSQAAPVIVPHNAPYISQQFARGKDIGEKTHNGIDIWAKRGWPVLAAAPGRVEASFYEPAYGHQVVIRHGLAPSGVPFRTVYMHLEDRMAQAGDTVARGQQIATLGDSGALSALVHLHFETQEKIPNQGWVPQDPQQYWTSGPGRVTCFERDMTYSETPTRLTYPVACK